MGNGVMTVTRAGVRVRKALSMESGTGPCVEFEIDSDHEHPIAVRIREPLPSGLDPSDIETEGEDDADGWWVFGGDLEFSRVVVPNETTRTAYVAHMLSLENGVDFDAPTIEAVLPVDPEDAENGDVPLWRGRSARAVAPGTGRNGPGTRTNGSSSTTRTGAPAVSTSSSAATTPTAVGDERPPERTGRADGRRSFEGPSVDVGTFVSALWRRFEPLLHLETVLQRPERVEALSDDAFDVLSNARRRRVLTHLFDADEPATLGDLSRSIAAWENDVSHRDVTSQQRKRVYTALRQNHLPKMDRAGVVDYDADRGSIELTDQAAGLRTYLDIPSQQWNWGRYYLFLGTFWCSVVAAIWTGLVPSGPVSGLEVAGLVGLSIVCSALAQTYAR